MDQLKQVQKYQFWILLSVALILPFVGWFMSRSGMMAEAADRTKALQGIDSSLTAGPSDPNDQFVKQVDGINVEQEKQSLLAWRALYGRQLPFMVWPKDMVDDPSRIEPLHQEIYRETYVKELERVRKVADPYDDETDKGLVRFPEELLPHPQDEWKFQAPSPKEIVAAQEDLWLLTAILRSIASVNEGAQNVYDAPIREIVELLLRGGSPRGSSSAGAGGGGAAKTPTGAAAGQGGVDMSAMKGMGGIMPGLDGSGGPGIRKDVSINLNDELGAERPAADSKTGGKAPAAGGSTATGNMAMPNSAANPDMAKSMMMTTSGGGTSRTASANMDRYCDDKKEWKTRGFSLEVIMDHRRIPELLVALSNTEGWPINILHVHVADYKDEDLVTADGAGGTGGAGGDMSRMHGIMPPPTAPRGPAGGHAGAKGMAAPPRAPMAPSRPATSRGAEETTEGPVITRDPLDDPNLATVAIVGVIYIFKQPPPATAAPQSPAATPDGAVTGAPATAPAGEAAGAALTEAADAAEEMEEKPESPAATGDSTDEADEATPRAPDADATDKAKPAANGKNGAGQEK